MALGAQFLWLTGQIGGAAAWCAIVGAFFAFVGLVVQPARRSPPPPLARALAEFTSLAPLPLVAVAVAAGNIDLGRSASVVAWPYWLVDGLAAAEFSLALVLVWRHRSRLALAAGLGGYAAAVMLIVWLVCRMAISGDWV